MRWAKPVGYGKVALRRRNPWAMVDTLHAVTVHRFF